MHVSSKHLLNALLDFLVVIVRLFTFHARNVMNGFCNDNCPPPSKLLSKVIITIGTYVSVIIC